MFDEGEQNVLTSADGKYIFAALQAGTYRVRIEPQVGWTRTTLNAFTVTLENGQTATKRLFGVNPI